MIKFVLSFFQKKKSNDRAFCRAALETVKTLIFDQRKEIANKQARENVLNGEEE